MYPCSHAFFLCSLVLKKIFPCEFLINSIYYSWLTRITNILSISHLLEKFFKKIISNNRNIRILLHCLILRKMILEIYLRSIQLE